MAIRQGRRGRLAAALPGPGGMTSADHSQRMGGSLWGGQGRAARAARRRRGASPTRLGLARARNHL